MSFTITETEVESVVCKISTKSDQGSGVIWKVNNEFSYILTCYHVIKDSKEFTIHIKENNSIKSIKINNIKDYFKNKSDDTAVIVIDNIIDEFFKIEIPLKIIQNEIDLNLENKLEFTLSGYPSIRNYDNDFNNIIIDKCRYSKKNILRTDVKLDTHTSFAIENVEGFSGGGVFLKYNNRLFLTTIVCEYYEKLNYFKTIHINKFNELLDLNHYHIISTYDNNIIYIDEILKKSKKEVESINSRIGKNIELERKVEVDKMCGFSKKINIVTGEPGIGKSVAIKKLVKRKNNVYCIYVRGEYITEKIQLNSIKSLLDNLENEVIFIIDSCEKVFENENNQDFIELVQNLYMYENMQIYFGIRDYSKGMLEKSIRVDCNIKETDIFLIKIPNINSDFAIIEELYPNVKTLSENTKELLKNPFYLNVIISQNQIGNITDIKNEFQIKDFIWKLITNNNIKIEKALITLVQERVNNNTEYVEINLSQLETKLLIDNNIIKKNNLLFAFTHDKFEDIAAKKLLDNLFVNMEINQLVLSLKNELSYGRIFKLWVKDRLSNNELHFINNEVERLYKDSQVSYLWKWNIIEAIYESNNFYEYLDFNSIKIEKDINFIKRIYEIAISSELIDLGNQKNEMEELKQYFNWCVVPSIKIFEILFFFYKNKKLIKDKNILYIVKIMEESTRVLRIFGKEVYKKYNFITDLLNDCILFVSTSKKYYSEGILLDLQKVFVCYMKFDTHLGKIYLNNIIENEQLSYFEEDLAKSIISKDSKKLVVVWIGFSEIYYDEILRLFTVHTNFDTNKRRHFSYDLEDEDYFGLTDDFRYERAYSNKLIIYDLFLVNFKSTLEYCINYINNAAQNYYDNRHNLRYNNVEKESFLYKKNQKEIYISRNFISAYRDTHNIPMVITSMLMAMERILLEKSELKDILDILEYIINKSNNYMLISLVMSIVFSNVDKYGDLFLELSVNYYIRDFEKEKLWDELKRKMINFPTRDPLEDLDREKREKFNHRRFDYDNIIMYLQQLEQYRNKVFTLIDELKKNFSEENLDMKNYLYNCDLRNCIKIPISEDTYAIEPKKNPDKNIEAFKEENKKIYNLMNDYNKYIAYLTLDITNNIDALEVKKFIEELGGKYESVSYYSINELKIYIFIFIIKNNELYNKNYINKSKENVIIAMHNIINNEGYIRADGLVFRLLEISNLLLSISSYADKQIISEFILNAITKIDFNINENKKLRDIMNQIQYKYYYVFDNIFKSLISFISSDDKKPVIKYKFKFIWDINKIISKLINNKYYSGKFKYNKIIINPEKMHTLKTIVLLKNDNNTEIVQLYIIEMLKLLKKQSKENVRGNYRVDLDIDIIEYLFNVIKNNEKNNKVIKYIMDNFIIFSEILLQIVDTLNAGVHDENTNPEYAWNFIKKVLDVIEKYPNKDNLYVTIKNNYVEDENNLNIGRLLLVSLLLNSSWINMVNPDEIKLISCIKDEYLEYNKKFISSSIGINNLAKLLYKYELQFNFNVLFDFTKEIVSCSTKQDYFSETNTMFYIESLFERIYKNYNTLNKIEKNKFYELLTCIGCNAPSPFLLYLKRILEY